MFLCGSNSLLTTDTPLGLDFVGNCVGNFVESNLFRLSDRRSSRQSFAPYLEVGYVFARRRCQSRQTAAAPLNRLKEPNKQMKNLALPVLCACLFVPALLANDWPQWRGSKRDDISTEQGFLREWPAGGPLLAWKATGLGAGNAGISVAAGRVYTMGQKDAAAFVLCFDASNGKPVWTAKLGPAGGDPPGPQGTPTFAGGQVYALGQLGDLVCLDATNGKEIWRKNLVKDLNGTCGTWKYAESPLVDGDKLICTPGGAQGAIAALNRKTGELLWQTKECTDSAEYSSIIVEEIDGVRQYIQLTGESVVGIDAGTGKLLWRAPRRGSTATIPTPIFADGCVYVTSGYGVGCNLFKITRSGDSFKADQVYANSVMVNQHGGVVLVGQYLYGFSDGKGWVCQDFKTGDVKWSNRGIGKGSLTYADGHLYLRSEGRDGTLALIEASPAGYKETGRFDQPDRSEKESWPHPVIANGKLFIRDQDTLLCFKVTSS
jgi:outer membrane protein assembly factor BamB